MTTFAKLVSLVALSFLAGCATPPEAEEEEGASTSHIERPVYRGNYLELVDATPDRAADQPHAFRYEAKDENGDPTELSAGESIVFKVSASTLKSAAWNSREIEKVDLSLSYSDDDYENQQFDSRDGSANDLDFGLDGWTSSAFTLPRSSTKAIVWFTVNGNPNSAPRSEIALGETVTPSPEE